MVRWCVIGAGGIADRRIIPGILLDSNSKLVAVMDKNPLLAKSVGEKYAVPYFTDESEMLNSIECDAVYIATPVFCHVEQAELCLSYGKHVFMEKPISIGSEPARRLLEKFKAAKKQLSIGYMMKGHNLHEKARELVRDGKIGQVCDVRAQFSCWYPDIQGAWRQKKALGGGGAIMDLGVHCLELIEYILDESISEVKAFYSTHTFKYEVDDSAVVIFKTESGTLGHVDVNFNIPDAASVGKLELYGTAGYIQCTGTLAQAEVGTLAHLYAPQGDYDAMQDRVEPKPEVYYGEESNLYVKEISKFTSLIESGERDYLDTERAVHIQDIVDKIYSEN